MEDLQVTYQDILDANKRLKGIVNKTPVFTSSAFNQLCGKLVYFKCEQFQKVGAFKFRGASNSVLLLSDEEAQKGVVTHSSGNHAQALALAAKERGIKAYIIMPKNSPKVKRDAVENTYKGQVIICESNTKAREDTCKQIQELTGSTFIAPYDNVNVIAGQGTAAIELLEEVEDLDAVVAPVGGGGLLSGTSIACKGFNPKIRVFGAEPKMANDAELSLKEGTIVPQLNPRTIADGLRTSLGVITFPIIKNNVDTIITVSEEEIINAMKWVWERMKLVIEPSSAVAVAVVLSDSFKNIEGIDKVGVIISGGNVDLDSWKWEL